MRKAFWKYILALLLFGSNGIVASHIALSSYEIVLLRTLIGSLLLLVILFLSGGRMTCRRHKRDFAFLTISGVAMGASWIFLYEAYDRIGVGVASLCYYCGPVLVMILSPLLFREKLSAGKGIGFLAVVLGVFLVNGRGTAPPDPRGLLPALLSAVMYAVMVIFHKKAAAITGLENAALQLFVAFSTAAVFVGGKQGFAMDIPAGSILPILILGLLNTGLGCYLYFSAIGDIPVQTVAICGYLEPLSAVLFSVVFLRETLSALQIVGAVLIIGGAAFGECVQNFGKHERTRE